MIRQLISSATKHTACYYNASSGTRPHLLSKLSWASRLADRPHDILGRQCHLHLVYASKAGECHMHRVEVHFHTAYRQSVSPQTRGFVVSYWGRGWQLLLLAS